MSKKRSACCSLTISRFRNDLKESYRGHWLQNKQSSQVGYIHLIPYILEVQVVHNSSPETTNYLRKGEGVRDYAPPVNSSEFLVLASSIRHYTAIGAAGWGEGEDGEMGHSDPLSWFYRIEDVPLHGVWGQCMVSGVFCSERGLQRNFI